MRIVFVFEINLNVAVKTPKILHVKIEIEKTKLEIDLESF